MAIARVPKVITGALYVIAVNPAIVASLIKVSLIGRFKGLAVSRNAGQSLIGQIVQCAMFQFLIVAMALGKKHSFNVALHKIIEACESLCTVA